LHCSYFSGNDKFEILHVEKELWNKIGSKKISAFIARMEKILGIFWTEMVVVNLLY
jgi:hypothetical protein